MRLIVVALKFKALWNGKHLKAVRNVNPEFEMGQMYI